jgi:distribution and morphology protein 34
VTISKINFFLMGHPDLEYFDPTYGLRPEGLPSKSGFKGFSNLFTPNKGLADLAEEESSE